MYVCRYPPHRLQKKALDPLELELQMIYKQICGCQKPKLGPLQEQQVHLTLSCFSSPGGKILDEYENLPGMVVPASDSSMWEAEAGGLL